jgi:spore photoproduct lyase
LGCGYCILSAYLGSEANVVFGNAAQEGLRELEQRLEEGQANDRSGLSHRYCTGEFADSLLLDKSLGLGERLVKLFRNKAPYVLELKTKTAQVDHLLDLDHGGGTVISFSVNAPAVSEREEPLAASLEDRLRAGRKAQGAGYRVGLHFDPIVFHPNWAQGYKRTVEMIDRFLDWEMVSWISLGCFRYLPSLKGLMLERGRSALFDQEFIRAGDGKMRYPRPLRKILYQTLLDCLRPLASPRTIIYLCMESGRLWRDLFGQDPGSPGLTAMFRFDSRPVSGLGRP